MIVHTARIYSPSVGIWANGRMLGYMAYGPAYTLSMLLADLNQKGLYASVTSRSPWSTHVEVTCFGSGR